MTTPGYFGSDGCDEPDYFDDTPEIDPSSFDFRDGSRIILVDFDTPIVTGKRQCEAREVAEWIEQNEVDNDQAIEYILKNYKH